MSDVIRIQPHGNVSLPSPRTEEAIRIRPGVMSDYAFIDDLQKRNKDGLGFMSEATIKGHLEKGNVLVAEALMGAGDGALGGGARQGDATGSVDSESTPRAQQPTPIGYVLGVDRYMKRDEVGIIYQMAVEPAYRRSLVAANLLKAKFEASAYGCRLYCCWCAQDLAANYFWESMGFVPLAFRTGGGRSKTKKDGKFRGRMHIFWQKRIRPRKWEAATQRWVDDDFPYWYPGVTGAGAIGEDRLVLPIPPGSHWSEAKPIVLPESPRPRNADGVDEAKLLEDEVARLEREKKALRKGLAGQRPGEQGDAGGPGETARKPSVPSVLTGGRRFGALPGAGAEVTAEQRAAEAKRQAAADAKAKAAAIEAELKEAKKAARKAKKQFDPAQVAFARELKDRWLEQVQAQPELLALPPGMARYDVRRALPGPAAVPVGLKHLGAGAACGGEAGGEPRRLEAA